jgi:hypothetical protein
MSGFKAKYVINEDKKVKDYHRSRRMFAIKDGKLFIADKGAEYSHADWFKKMHWIDEDDDSLMDIIVRGAVEPNGVYFYKGYTFEVDKQSEAEMMTHLPELVNMLNISNETHLFGGKIIVTPNSEIKPRIDFGKIEHLLKR